MQLPGEPGDRAARPPRARAHHACSRRRASGRTCSPRCRCGRPTPRRSSAASSTASGPRPSEAEILRADGKPVPAGLRLALRARRVLRLRPVRDQLGPAPRALGATPAARRSGPTPSASSASFGVNLKQVYGSTETRGARLASSPTTRPTRPARASPCPGIEVKIADRGEVLVRERGCLQGLLQERRRPRARSSTPRAGSTPATPASSTRAGTSSSSTAPRTWAPLADGTPVRAAVHREQAQVQPVHPRGGRLRQRPAVRGAP